MEYKQRFYRSLASLVSVSYLLILFVFAYGGHLEDNIYQVAKIGGYILYLTTMIQYWEYARRTYQHDLNRLWWYRVYSLFHPLLATYDALKHK